eukprot:3227061-Alexandrium_andersonii.AAC.1
MVRGEGISEDLARHIRDLDSQGLSVRAIRKRFAKGNPPVTVSIGTVQKYKQPDTNVPPPR